jgi:hypothetical protein
LTLSGGLPTDSLITFYIHIKNTDYIDRFGLQTGFQIYSPDGATWDTTIADTVDFGWGSWRGMFDMAFLITSYSADGVGADTVSFGGVAMLNGMPYYFDETSYAITIGPIDESMDGKTIRLDSSFFQPAGNWMWCDQTGMNITEPPWGGLREYTIEKTNLIFYSGHLYYLDPVPPDTNPMPMRYVTIEMWDDDMFPNPDDSLGIDFTTDSGYFDIGPIENSDAGGGLDVYFKIYAENGAAYVTEDYNDDIYMIQTPVQNNLPSGLYDTTIVAPIDTAGAFFIADVILEGHDFWETVTGNNLESVQVVSDHRASGSGFYDVSGDFYIFIEGATAYDGFWPQYYDKDVILHEYAHFIEEKTEFFDASPGGNHSWCLPSSDTMAASEGFAHFFCNLYNNDPVRGEYNYNYQKYAWFNSENGQAGIDATISCSANDFGDTSECAVAGILWDIYDNSSTSLPIQDDYSTPPADNWPNLNDTADGIGDTLSDGFNNIRDVLLNRTIGGDPPDDINEFWDAWFQSPSKGHIQAM